MSQRLGHLLPKLLALTILVNLLSLLGCGGSAGAENGQVVGTVYSNLQDNSATRAPESGVSVVAQKQDGIPLIIRNTITNSKGAFVFSDLPTGSYMIGYAKEGFVPIQTSAGDTNQRTAVGDQIRVYVESGATSVAPDVTLRAYQASGDFTAIVTVLDSFTALPITNATVSSSGGSVSQNTNGVYTLTIPIISKTEFPPPSPPVQTVAVVAEGFAEGSVTVSNASAGQSQKVTISLIPLKTVTLTGSFRFTTYENLYQGATISLQVKDLSIPGAVDIASGKWEIPNLPPSTATITRQFDLIFSHPNLKTYTLQKVVMPVSGTKTITQPVLLEPITVDVIGNVLVSNDDGKTQLVPSGSDDMAWIAETGQTGTVSNGTFLISQVPVQQSKSDTGFTMKIIATHPTDKLKYRVADVAEFKPVASSAGTFFAGTFLASQKLSGQ